MTWLALTTVLLQLLLLLVSTCALRHLYFTSPLTADFVAARETASDTPTGPFLWFVNTLLSCPECLTYWIGALCALAIWIPRNPFNALSAALLVVSAGWLINRILGDPRRAATIETVVGPPGTALRIAPETPPDATDLPEVVQPAPNSTGAKPALSAKEILERTVSTGLPSLEEMAEQARRADVNRDQTIVRNGPDYAESLPIPERPSVLMARPY